MELNFYPERFPPYQNIRTQEAFWDCIYGFHDFYPDTMNMPQYLDYVLSVLYVREHWVDFPCATDYEEIDEQLKEFLLNRWRSA